MVGGGARRQHQDRVTCAAPSSPRRSRCSASPTPALAQTYPDRRSADRAVSGGRAGRRHGAHRRPAARRRSSASRVVIENRGGASGAIGGKARRRRRARRLHAAVRQHQLAGRDAGRQPTTATTIRPRRSRRSPSSRRTTRCWWCIPDFPAKSVQELVAYAKANPGKLNFGSPGPGNASHLAAELFKLKTGIDIVHVPYKGAAEVVTARDGRTGADVLRRHRRHAAADPRGPRCGRWRCPARRAAPRCPTLPTMIESGVPDYVVLTFIGVVAPAATPPAIVAKLNAAINQACGRRRWRPRCAGSAPSSAGIGAGVRRVPRRASATNGREVVRLSGIKIE